MKTKISLSLTALLLITVAAGTLSASAQASTPALLKFAQQELKKKVKETNGNNIPRGARGAVASYSIKLPWCVSFVSVGLSRAGYSSHLEPRSMPSQTGQQVIGYTGTLISWGKKQKRLTKVARPGYIAVYREYVTVVEKVNRRGAVVSEIGGNLNDAVTRRGAGAATPLFFIRV